MAGRRIYKENRKHKEGCFGEGLPRWFPDFDSRCPEDIDTAQAQALLEDAVEGADSAHPDARALYAMDEQGRFFKAYCHLQRAEENREFSVVFRIST